MIPRFRAWNKATKEIYGAEDIIAINFEEKEICVQTIYFEQGLPDSRDLDYYDFDDIVLMQSTGMRDKNDREIFEGDILKFNDEWNDYCYEGYIDGSIEGINYVEVERETTCFSFGETKISDSSLFHLINDEHLSFKELIEDEGFEFEIIGNIWEDGELLDVENEVSS